MTLTIWLTSALLAAASVVPGAQRTAGDAVTSASSIQRETLVLDDGSTLRYAIVVPQGYDGSREAPLVLALHFGWAEALPPNYSAVFLEILVEPALRELGAILVAPLCPARTWVDPRSERAVLGLLEHVRGQYRTDPERTLVTGFSLGGMGTWYYASHHPELFSAALPMASVPMIARTAESGAETVQRYVTSGSVEWPATLLDLPLYIIHSRDDELIPIAPVERAAAELTALGGNVEFHPIDAGIGHHETPRYVPYLARAVPWLQRLWEQH
ncbi:MAG: alpha/beta hydrolase-fold protein [Acidobacteriota bacterium]|jgi:predicted peptidase